MTPKEKAQELVKQYLELLKKTDTCLAENCNNTLVCQHNSSCEGWLSYAKQSASTAVDEILTTLYDLKFGNALVEELDYWEEVKQEIQNKH